MLRRGLQLATGVRNSDLKLLRTEEGRPYMEGLQHIDVNVSHHGDFVGGMLDNMNILALSYRLPLISILLVLVNCRL